jgi:hypothetical protein
VSESAAELELVRMIQHADAARDLALLARLLEAYRSALLALRPFLLRAKLAAHGCDDAERWGGDEAKRAALEAFDVACREVRENATRLFVAAIGAASEGSSHAKRE